MAEFVDNNHQVKDEENLEGYEDGVKSLGEHEEGENRLSLGFSLVKKRMAQGCDQSRGGFCRFKGKLIATALKRRVLEVSHSDTGQNVALVRSPLSVS